MKKILLSALMLVALSSVSLAQRTLITAGEQYVGGKIALGSIGGASMGFIGNYEYGYQDNIGIGGAIAYSGYSEDISAGFYTGKWSYSNILVVVSGNYHMDLLKNEKLDTWGALNVGYNVASVKWEFTKNTLNLPEPAAASAGGFVFGLTANARYQLTEKLFATGSLGFGLGVLNIGLDYKL